MKFTLYKRKKNIKKIYRNTVLALAITATLTEVGLFGYDYTQNGQTVVAQQQVLKQVADTKTSINDIQKQLIDNKLFMILRKGDTFDINPRVVQTGYKYSDVLTSFYKLVPANVQVSGLKFSTDDATVTVKGQGKTYSDLVNLFNNLTSSDFSKNLKFTSIGYNQQYDVVDYQLTLSYGEPVTGTKDKDTQKQSTASVPADPTQPKTQNDSTPAAKSEGSQANAQTSVNTQTSANTQTSVSDQKASTQILATGTPSSK